MLKLHDDKPVVERSRLDDLRIQIENHTDALPEGALKDSSSLGRRLARTERKLEELEAKAAQPAIQATRLIPRLADGYRA